MNLVKVIALNEAMYSLPEIKNEIEGAIRFFFDPREYEIKFYNLTGVNIPIDMARAQVDARDVLKAVEGKPEIQQQEGDILILLTDRDLYVPNMNFVFGVADIRRKRIVLSLYRLKRDVYLVNMVDIGKYKERVFKEIMHEIGHILGLKHCDDKSCVMSFSKTITEVDEKLPMFCRSCLSKLEDILGKKLISF